jgi:hypothetical protein
MVVIFAAESLHPKIPFMADTHKDGNSPGFAAGSGDFGTGKIVVIAAN